MNDLAPQWIVIANGNEAKLILRSNVVGRPHMEEVETFVNRWQAPSAGPPLSLRSPKDNHSYGSQRHVAEEHERRYANYLAQWIEGIVEERELNRVFVFASPRLQGWLKKAYTTSMIRYIRSRTGDFAHARASALAVHPAFQDLVAGK